MLRALLGAVLLGVMGCIVRGAAAQTAPIQAPASAYKEASTLTFSNLILRLDGQDEIGLAKADFRVLILEQLRADGFKARGAENLVFGIDKSKDADFALGGTVRELECFSPNGQVRACRIGIDWELFDLRRERVVYAVRSRFAAYGLQRGAEGQAAKQLMLGALRSLTGRPRFRSALSAFRTPERDPSHPAAAFKRCAVPAQPMPGQAESALDATVIVTDGRGHGSGFFLTDDGLVMTAAHVVSRDQLEIKTRKGEVFRAVPVRMARNRDAALLRIEPVAGGSRAATPCLPLNLEAKSVGSELFAVGAPASQDLAFSLTRGIVSGVRQLEGVSYLQTDASVSPGNSGGPLVGADGRVAALVSWKVAGGGIEGIAFGVPIEQALTALGLEQAETTALTLHAPVRPGLLSEASAVVADTPDWLPVIDPEGDARRARIAATQQARLQQAARDHRIDAVTPGYVLPLRWGGVALSALGLTAALGSRLKFDPERSTRSEYDTLRLVNDIGWVAFGVGAAAFTVSWLLVPDDPGERAPAAARARVEVGPGALQLRVAY